MTYCPDKAQTSRDACGMVANFCLASQLELERDFRKKLGFYLLILEVS